MKPKIHSEYSLFKEWGADPKGKLLPLSEYRPFGGKLPGDEVMAEVLAQAEGIPVEMPLLPATLYADFVRNGDRTRYQKIYYARRDEALILSLAEAYEGKGRFVDRIVDRVWAILEETTWVVPAHADVLVRRSEDSLPFSWRQGGMHYVDLFAAGTGATLAMVKYLAGAALADFSGEICPRIDRALEERILMPFRTRRDMWWMGSEMWWTKGKTSVNNWNPWILSNILTVTALQTEDMKEREADVAAVMRMADRFTVGYAEDGGCDEGPSYWGEAGACLFDICDILADMSGGKLSFWEDDLLRAILEYRAKAHIAGNYFLNFADSPPKIDFGGRYVGRMGETISSPLLSGFSRLGGEEPAIPNCCNYNAYRFLGNLVWEPAGEVPYVAAKRVWFDGLKVMIVREHADGRGLYFAMKGGHNGESHNHNDVGNFVVYDDGEPLLVDAGSDEYTAKTFSDERYTLWQNTSPYHSLPTFGGVGQPAGSEYASRMEVPEEKGLSLELSDAYSEEAGVVTFRRSGTLENGALQLVDAVSLKGKREVCFHLISAVLPEITSEGIRLGKRLLTYPAELAVAVEPIPLSSVMRERWGRENLYRILLKTETAGGVFSFRLE